MLQLVIFLLAIVGALGAAVPDGMLQQLEGRIVDGTPTSISSYPWQVSVQRKGYHFCGGSIISSEIVVTAAHCLRREVASDLRVRAGSSLWISGGVLVRVASFKYHENYSPSTMVNDIAVIRLSSSLTFSPTIRTISLATMTPVTGAAAVVSGWGITKFGSVSTPTQLKYVEMTIVSRDDCASSNYAYGSNIKKTMICTYRVGQDSCQGDSGGPLISGGVLVGVVSWGFECALPRHPGVYASVADLRDWVLTTAESI